MPIEEPPTASQMPKVVDPHLVPVVFADWLVTGGVFDGIVNLALGTVDHSTMEAKDEHARIVIAARLQMTTQFAAKIHALLGHILNLPGAGPAVPTPQKPQKDTIN